MTTPAPGRGNVGIFFHRRVEESRRLGEALVAMLDGLGARSQLLDAWESRELLADRLIGLDWAAVLGGDGTMLRIVGLLAPLGIPVLGVNFGRLGFLTEIPPAEAEAALSRVLAGEGRVEDRLMLEAGATIDLQPVLNASGARRDGTPPLAAGVRGVGVNDVFIGRGGVAHAVRLELAIDGQPLLRLTADGLVLASPTGSSAYSLSAGGPIVEPRMSAIVLTPVVPHPVPVRALVLPGDAVVTVTVRTEEEAILSLDGQRHYRLPDGATVRVAAHPRPARFLRLGDPAGYYGTMVQRLG